MSEEKKEPRYEKKLIPTTIPVKCPKCGEILENQGLGIFICPKCDYKVMDDFGKVRDFLEQNGKAPAIVISAATGVRVDKIDKFLREGRVEIPDGSEIYIKCENCGRDIRYGRFCPECAMKLTKKIQGAMNANEVGEIPRKVNGKMRFLDEKNNKRR